MPAVAGPPGQGEAIHRHQGGWGEAHARPPNTPPSTEQALLSLGVPPTSPTRRQVQKEALRTEKLVPLLCSFIEEKKNNKPRGESLNGLEQHRTAHPLSTYWNIPTQTRHTRTCTHAPAAQRTAGRRGGQGAASGSLPTRMCPGCPAQRPLEGACGVVPRDGGSEGHVCTPSRPLWRAPNGSVPAGTPLQAGAPRSVLPYRPRPDVASGRL